MKDALTEFEIYDLPDNEKIEAPGFYRISMDRHHNQPCDGVSVTSGILRRMDPDIGSPSEVWAHHVLNPNRIEKKETSALRLGRVMAAYIENGPEGVEEFVRVTPSAPTMSVVEMLAMAEAGAIKPERAPNRPTFEQVEKYVAGTATPAAVRSVEYHLELENDPRDKVTETEWALICDMGRALLADEAAAAALGGIPEITMAWFDEETQLWCLARPDQVSFGGMLTDYKKMAPAGRVFNARMVDQRIEQHGYDMQMAFARDAFEQIAGFWPSDAPVGIVAQSDTAPFDVILRAFDEHDLRIGSARNRLSLREFRRCLDSGHWPKPGDHVGSFRRYPANEKRLLELLSAAGFDV